MKRHLRSSSSAAVLISGLILMGVSALPAQAADSDTAEASAPTLIVTAQRRSQAIKDIGLALNVLSGNELQNRGVNTVNDLQYHTPSLEITPAFGGGQPQFRLRGVGFEDYATNNTPTVGVYVDEVAFPVPAATQGVLYDIERVEVLRGPQGTLYGRNTTGGAINFLTRRPTDGFSAGFTADYGSFSHTRAEGYISGPLTDTLKARLSAVTEQGGAWQKNRVTGEKLGDTDRLAGRLQLQWTPDASFDALLNIHAGSDQSDGAGGYLLVPFATAFGAGPTVPADGNHRLTGWGLSAPFAAISRQDINAKPSRDNHSRGASLTANWSFAGAKLTSISAFDHLKRRELNDWDATSYHESDTFWASDVDVTSQELRLASDGDGKLKWLAGVYLSDQKLKEVFLTDFSGSLGFITNTNYTQTVSSAAGFGQVEYEIGPRTRLIGGLRYEHEDRRLKGFRTQIGATPTFTDGDRGTGFDQTSGKASLEFKPNDQTLTYLSLSRGVKSGGFTVYNSPSARQIDAFQPEVLWAYEAGFKSQLSPDLYVNGAAFYYDYRDQQVLTAVLDPVYGAIGRIANAPKSRIAGVELEAAWKPAKGLTVTQTLAYKKGEYREFNDVNTATAVQNPTTHLWSAQTIDRSGQDLGFPKLSYNGAIAYGWESAGLLWRAGADASYRDKLTSWLGPDFNVKAYWLANGELSVTPKNGHTTFSLYGRNLLDTKYDVTRNYFLPFAKVGWAGRPQTFGVRLQYAY